MCRYSTSNIDNMLITITHMDILVDQGVVFKIPLQLPIAGLVELGLHGATSDVPRNLNDWELVFTRTGSVS